MFLFLTVIVGDDAALRSVHVGGRHEGEVAELEDGADEAEDVVDLVGGQPDVLHGFLKKVVNH
jgi:hypothetical protein